MFGQLWVIRGEDAQIRVTHTHTHTKGSFDLLGVWRAVQFIYVSSPHRDDTRDKFLAINRRRFTIVYERGDAVRVCVYILETCRALTSTKRRFFNWTRKVPQRSISDHVAKK